MDFTHFLAHSWFVLPCWEGSSVSRAGRVCSLPTTRCWCFPWNSWSESHGSRSHLPLARPHARGPPHTWTSSSIILGVKTEIRAVSTWRSAAGLGSRCQGVTALGRGTPIVTVIAIVNTGPDVHTKTSLGLFLNLKKTIKNWKNSRTPCKNLTLYTHYLLTTAINVENINQKNKNSRKGKTKSFETWKIYKSIRTKKMKIK